MLKSSNMKIVEKNGVVFLRFKGAEKFDFINFAVSTRIGGVSEGEKLKSMNLGLSTGDRKENIVKNYEIFSEAAGFTVENFVVTKQTHSSDIRKVSECDRGKGVYKERDYDSADALICNLKHTPIAVHSADCVPVVLIDEENKAVGACHCGHRGTFLDLAVLTLERMEEEFNTKAENVTAFIGPAICRNCYEVSFDLYEKFIEKFGNIREISEESGKFYLDLCGINAHRLKDAGVRETVVSDICTCCNKEYMYSHRGQGAGRGIFAAAVEIIK